MSPRTPNPTDMHGLPQAEARRRLQAEGLNESSTARSHDIPAIALEVVREPMFLLLLVAGAIYVLLGDVSDALMLLGFVCMVMGITIYQERKTYPFDPMEQSIHARGEYYQTDTEHLYHFSPHSPYQLALSFAVGSCSVLRFELHKFIRRH